jgi:hypothetical protein
VWKNFPFSGKPLFGKVIIQVPELHITAADVICKAKKKMKYTSNIRITGV